MSNTPKADALKDRYCLHGIDWYHLCAELERENAALRAQDAWLVATFGNLEDENQKLRAELEAQAVVNGKGGEREAKLLAEVAALTKRLAASDGWDDYNAIKALQAENAALRAERDALKDALEYEVVDTQRLHWLLVERPEKDVQP